MPSLTLRSLSARVAVAGLPLALAACAASPTATPGPVAEAPAGFSQALRLVGTEPFWGGRVSGEGVVLSGAERPEMRLPAVAATVTGDTARWRTPADGVSGAPSTVLITATAPGANMATVERTVTNVIEAALSGMDGVHGVRSTTAEGRAIITAAFLPGQTAEARATAVRATLARLRLPARAGAEVTLARPQPLDLTLVRQTCSDGMSDRSYPFAATVVFAGETLRGCAAPESAFAATP